MTMTILSGAILSSFLPSFASQQDGSAQPTASQQYNNCVTIAEKSPQRAVDFALKWQSKGGGTPARHCEAIGLYSMGKFRPAGLMLDRVAGDMRIGKDMPIVGGKRTTGNAVMLTTIYIQSAQSWMLAKDLGHAITAADNAVALAPKKSELYYSSLFNRALILAADDDYKAAFDDLAILKTVSPDSKDILLLYATAARFTKRYNQALEALTLILIKDTDHVVALLERGNVFAQMGKKKEAINDWFKIIELKPNSDAATSARNNLQRQSQNTPKSKM